MIISLTFRIEYKYHQNEKHNVPKSDWKGIFAELEMKFSHSIDGCSC